MLHIDFPPVYKASSKGPPKLSVQSTGPLPLSVDSLSASNRERIPPPRKAFDFLPDLMAETEENYKPRQDVKPIHVIQPEGVSFKMNGHELEWQKWKMHICKYIRFLSYSFCELKAHGYLFQHSATVRELSFRPSLTTIMARFGLFSIACPSQRWLFLMQPLNFLTPESLLSIRKYCLRNLQGENLLILSYLFTLSGEYGMGTMANELTLGCDCLGQIHYLVCPNGQIDAVRSIKMCAFFTQS